MQIYTKYYILNFKYILNIICIQILEGKFFFCPRAPKNVEPVLYALHITESYDDFETESFLHEAINVAAKHCILE